MKKFMKGCAIAASIMIIIGLVFGTVTSFSMKRGAMNEFMDKMTGGMLTDWRIQLEDWGFQVRDGYVSGYNDFTGYEIEDYDMFSEDHDIVMGDIKRYQIPDTGIKNMNIEVGGCVFNIQTSEDDTFYISGDNARKLQVYLEGDTLMLKSLHTANDWKEINKSYLDLYIPSDFQFDTIDVNFGAGSMYAEEMYGNTVRLEAGAGGISVDILEATALELSVGAGEIVVDNMETDSLTASAQAGHLYAYGSVNETVNSVCNAGSLELYLAGSEDDYNYDIKNEMGAVDIDGTTYGGLSNKKRIDNGASRNINVECSVGNVEIYFD